MRPTTLVSILISVLLPLSVRAHHGSVTNALLYQSELVELQGEIVDVFWRNPHARARLSVVDDSGGEVLWELELGPNPRRLENMGLTSRHLLGTVRVAGHASRRDPQSLGYAFRTLVCDCDATVVLYRTRC